MVVNENEGGFKHMVSAPIAKAITPGDSGAGYANGETISPEGNKACRALYIGATGDLSVKMVGSGGDFKDTVTFIAVPVGVLPIQVERVFDTDTTASSIIALF
ncbi:MAG: hypothetical protein O3B04_09635 [Chloroflexi bacterium]|nr:hypothetical protein [Chloroflexota bacterium]